MAQTNISIRIDEELKKQFEKFCSDTGMTMTTAVKEQRIPFEITADPFYSAANMERLEKAVKDIEKGKTTVHDLIEVEDE